MAVAYSYNPALINSYRAQSVVGLNPGQLVLKMYDLALSAMAAQDESRACRVLAELIDCLDFRSQDIAAGFFRLYRYCMEEIKKGEYEVPTTIIRELRKTWAQALQQVDDSSD